MGHPGTTAGGGVNGVVSARDGAGHSGQSLESLSALPSHYRVMHYGDKEQGWTNLDERLALAAATHIYKDYCTNSRVYLTSCFNIDDHLELASTYAKGGEVRSEKSREE